MSYERIISRCFKNLKPEDAAGFFTFDNQAATMLNVKPGFNIVNSLVTPEVWNTSLIRTIAVSVTIPETLEPPDSKVNSDF